LLFILLPSDQALHVEEQVGAVMSSNVAVATSCNTETIVSGSALRGLAEKSRLPSIRSIQHGVTGFELAGRAPVRKRIFDAVLDHAAQWPRAELGL